MRGIVHSYHHKPHPLKLSYGAKKADIKGLKKKHIKNLIVDGEEFESKFTVGFEVEKNELSTDALHEHIIFCGFERDSSCGYEAVTHILPLLPSSTWRTKVFDLMHQAEQIIDDKWSPSDERCGGHVTVAVDGMYGDELRQRIRKNMGIIYAMFRHRLKNTYCSTNLRIQGEHEEGHYNGWNGKYQPVYMKGSLCEIRLFNRVSSVRQLMRRYELMYEIMDYSINHPNAPHAGLMKRLRPILIDAYEGNEQQVDRIIKLAGDFREFILKGKISQAIQKYII